MEGVGDDRAGDAPVGAEVEHESGVVIEPADHLDVFACGEADVGEV